MMFHLLNFSISSFTLISTHSEWVSDHSVCVFDHSLEVFNHSTCVSNHSLEVSIHSPGDEHQSSRGRQTNFYPTYLNDVSPTQFQYFILHFNFQPLSSLEVSAHSTCISNHSLEVSIHSPGDEHQSSRGRQTIFTSNFP